MPEELPESQPETTFESSRKEAKRATWALNSLVVLSALAGAFFFGYVLHTVQPFAGRDTPPVEIPVSSPSAKVGVLSGEQDGLAVTFRDIDEAPTYREELSKVMIRELAIDTPGRLYVLVVRNDGEDTYSFSPSGFNVADKDARNWKVRWLGELTSRDKASAVGKLRLAQSAHNFELSKGESRQLFVFIESAANMPPSAEDFVTGTLKSESGDLKLEHTEVKVAER